MDCLFCSIARKETQGEIVFENEKFIAFKDINPKASVHLLIVPKQHIESLQHITERDKELMGELLLTVQSIAQDMGLKGYKVQMNVGRKGGQEIDHMHFHLLADNTHV